MRRCGVPPKSMDQSRTAAERRHGAADPALHRVFAVALRDYIASDRERQRGSSKLLNTEDP
jgi:hypothetical protein